MPEKDERTAPAAAGPGTAPEGVPGEDGPAGGHAAGHRHPVDAQVVDRLKSIAGHVKGIQRMVEDDAYCMDVVNQILAVQRALKKVTGRVLDRHLHSCATAAMKGDDPAERERVIAEIVSAFEAAGRA